MREALPAKIQQTITKHRLLPGGARVVVAVSGGADSVALLQALALLAPAWKLTLHVAHLDHGLRPESTEDARFVRALAVERRLPVTIERRDVAAACAREGWSLEDGARRVRYEFLLKVARGSGAGHLALAHTADDQVETVLMRLVRGTGLMGLSGMRVKRPLEEVWVVRPLLEVWRQELIAWLKAEGFSHREDATNADQRFLRNRIRHELLPLLEREYNPNIRMTLYQLAQQSTSDYTYLREEAGRQWKRLARAHSEAPVGLRVSRFLRQPKALQRQLVRQAIQRVRGDLNQFEYRHWLEAERLFAERPLGTIVHLPGGVQLRREKERVVCERAARQACLPRQPSQQGARRRQAEPAPQD